jgi:O-antigen biosynthesis protein
LGAARWRGRDGAWKWPCAAAIRGLIDSGALVHFSIVVPSHHRADLLALCLASVQRHAPPDTDVVVVDDASREGLIGRTAERFGGVRVVRLPRRLGFCGAVNAGILAAEGEVVELLNDDAEVTPGWAEPALAWFERATFGAVAPLVLMGPAGESIDSAGDRYYAGGVAAKWWHGLPAACAPRVPRQVFGASGSSAFYRRDALLRIGGFAQEFTSYFDDVDVAFRLNRAGWRTMFEPASRVLHRIAASHGRPARRLLEQQALNEERVFWRNLPSLELARALPLHLAVLAAKACRRWQEGMLSPFVCGRLRLLGELRQLIRHRRRLNKMGPRARLEAWCVERRYWL